MSDVITDDERHEAATEEPTTVGCPSLGLGKLPGGFDGTEPGEKRGAHKHGMLANGVQMIRYESGPTVTLIGKRERDPTERQGGRTGKIIYKVVVWKDTHIAEVIADGAAVCTVFAKSNVRIEHYGLALVDSWLKFNAKKQRNKRKRLNRRKAEALADGSASAGREVAK